MQKNNLDEVLKNLNPEQLEAVNTTEGPVMVIAGPGTGKTQILSGRIANILNKNLSEAKNILCLTYTDAGTIAMRKRLFSFIGGEAYKVNIHTFHGFCNEIIQENLDYFQKRELDLVSDLEKIQILEKIIKNLKIGHLLYKRPNGDISFEVYRLKSLFEVMKSEDWKVKNIEKAIEEYIEDLPNREGFSYKRKYKQFQAGDLKPEKINAEKEKMAKLLAGANLFGEYQKYLKENNKYDYQDMILWIIKAFKENPEILAKYQEQFLYILVDEFQDTNGSQKEILDLLTSFWEEPNIFVVGDDDQSIFRFQGANLKNIISFYSDYKSVKTVVLKRNYRSSQKILDLAKSSIEFNLERLISEIPSLDKNLIAENPQFKNSQIEPKIVEYFNTIHEEAGIVEEIEKLQKNGVDLDEVAIIYQKHSQSENILKALEQKQIPVNIKKAVNILFEPLIEKLVTIFIYLEKESEKPYSNQDDLFKILNFDFFGISIKNLAILLSGLGEINKNPPVIARRHDEAIQKENNSIQRKNNSVDDRHACHLQKILPNSAPLHSQGQNINNEIFVKLKLRDLICSKENLDKITQISAEERDNIFKIGTFLNDWIGNISNKTIQEQLEIILSESGILKKSLNSSDKVWQMRLLNTFFNFIKEESKKKQNIKMKDFVEIISQMKINSIQMPVSKVTFAKKGVNFITAHSSKGLEFKYVFLIGVQEKIWEKKRKPATNFSMPDTLTFSNAGDDIEELRRLFFVSITRAKEFLQISYSAKNIDDKDQMASQFVNEIIQQNPNLKAEKKALSDEKIEEFSFLLYSQNESETNLEFFDKEEIDNKLKDYSLSVSDLNKYLKCPISFYFENILKVPRGMNASMAFGRAIHYSFEYYFKKAKKDEKFGDLGLLLFFFEKGLKLNHSSFKKEEFKKFLEHGKENLKGYFEKYSKTFNLNIISEYRIFSNLGEIPINGALDMIEFISNSEVKVIDFKTGKYSNVKKYGGFSIPNKKFENGGDYWRQIIFYKILIKNNPKHLWKMSEGIMDFVEKDEKTGDFQKEIIKIDEESEEIVKNQIKEVYKKIKTHQFFTGCNEENCKWCEFVKNQKS